VRNINAIGRLAASIGAVALITALYSEVLRVNPTTVALSYLIAILLIATTWGIVEATTASILAVLCFNFFFLPPMGTFTIADPQNRVAFVAFLVTAIVASQLSGRARQRAQPGTSSLRGRRLGVRSDRTSYCRDIRAAGCRSV
jgi:two-component system sensor histidine kinase KdpD